MSRVYSTCLYITNKLLTNIISDFIFLFFNVILLVKDCYRQEFTPLTIYTKLKRGQYIWIEFQGKVHKKTETRILLFSWIRYAKLTGLAACTQLTSLFLLFWKWANSDLWAWVTNRNRFKSGENKTDIHNIFNIFPMNTSSTSYIILNIQFLKRLITSNFYSGQQW